jgi:hypothetical protein
VVLTEAAGGNGDVVEEAETHRPVSLGVVPRRPHQGEAVVRPVGHNRVDQRQETSAGQERRFVGARRHGCVGVKGLRPAACGARHKLEVLLRVHQRNLLGGRRPRFEAYETGTTEAFDKVAESGDPLRALRVPVPGVVALVALVDHNRGSQHGNPLNGPLPMPVRLRLSPVGVPVTSLHNQR